MLEEELIAVLALQKAKGIGDIIAKKLISHCGSAQNVFSEKKSAVEKINGIGSITISNLKNKTWLLNAEKEAKHVLSKKISYTYFKDASYPEKLKHCIE